jgi:hypothetical protein
MSRLGFRKARPEKTCSHSLIVIVVALLPFLLSSVRACSNTTFDPSFVSSSYPYPDCALACMACRDPDYTSDFANSCDYAAGACCTSEHHTAIESVWQECVLPNCGPAVGQSSFDIFVRYCSDKGLPLAAADVPIGLVAATNVTGNRTDAGMPPPRL